MTIDDARRIVGWVSSQAEVTLFAGPALCYPLTPESFLEAARDGRTSYVLHDHAVPTATGSWREPAAGIMRIGHVLVDPSRRREGWGRRIMSALLALAERLLAIDRVQLGVYEQNLVARRLYSSLGFTDTGKPTRTEVCGQVWSCRQLDLHLSEPRAGDDRGN